jgi:hypothetical protein
MKKHVLILNNGKNAVVVKFGLQNTTSKYFSITAMYCKRATKKEIARDEDIITIENESYKIESTGHDIIKEHLPQFNDFVRMNLADINGAPMHAIANSFYHLQNGFVDVPLSSPNFKDEFCKYYRIPSYVFDIVKDKDMTVTQYENILSKNNVMDIWQLEAKIIISKYELI